MIMEKTSRRPAIPSIKPDGRFSDQLLVELPFPAQRAVADDLITSYLNTIRRATQTIYVLDLSGSMRGARIDALRSALIALAGGQGKIKSGGFAVFRERETVSLLGYSDKPRRPQAFTIPAGGSRKVLADIRDAVRDLQPGGNTATYSALKAAYRLAVKQTAARPGAALTTIVVMTDGETNLGITAAQFRATYRSLPRAARAVPTFTVKFGSADAKSLDAVARLTGGKLIEAENNRLARAFKGNPCLPVQSRILDYLGSTPNLVGSGLALVALMVSTITGLAGALWPVLVVLAYAAGAVLSRLTFNHDGHDGHHTPAATRPRRAIK
jgi:Ca-activated chloride channel homolog